MCGKVTLRREQRIETLSSHDGDLDYGRHDLHNPLPRYGVSSGWLVSVPNQTTRTSRSPSCDTKGAILHRQVARSPTSTAACEGKTVVQVYDYADTRVPVLKRGCSRNG